MDTEEFLEAMKDIALAGGSPSIDEIARLLQIAIDGVSARMLLDILKVGRRNEQ